MALQFFVTFRGPIILHHALKTADSGSLANKNVIRTGTRGPFGQIGRRGTTPTQQLTPHPAPFPPWAGREAKADRVAQGWRRGLSPAQLCPLRRPQSAGALIDFMVALGCGDQGRSAVPLLLGTKVKPLRPLPRAARPTGTAGPWGRLK